MINLLHRAVFPPASRPTFSLNREKREQELFRINQENCAILERITKCKSRYSIQKWSEDWRKTKNYMSSITRYPQSLCELQIQKVIAAANYIHITHFCWSVCISRSSVAKLYLLQFLRQKKLVLTKSWKIP